MNENLGPLAAALAKAQASFGTVKRDKTVKVTTKTGGSYSFKYAPLESVLDAVRQPLADNGLVVVQLLDEGNLVTSLIHESGALLIGAVAIPAGTDIKEMGSAITYLRRYALQALLGIAAEDDDDGSRAVGDRADPVEPKGTETLDLLGNIQKAGTLAKGTASTYDGEWRQTPEGWSIGLKLKLSGEDRDIPQVLIRGAIGDTLYASGASLVGLHVTVKGKLHGVKAAGRATYYRLIVGDADSDFIETPDYRVPALLEPVAPGQETAFDLTDEALK